MEGILLIISTINCLSDLMMVLNSPVLSSHLLFSLCAGVNQKGPSSVSQKNFFFCISNFQLRWEGTKVSFLRNNFGRVGNVLLAPIQFVHFWQIKPVLSLSILPTGVIDADVEGNFWVQRNQAVHNIFTLKNKVVVGPVTLLVCAVIKINIKRTWGEWVLLYFIPF